MKYLITGGAGFIGSNLADHLLANGHHLVILDNFDDYYPRKIKEDNLIQALSYSTCKLVEGDVRNRSLLRNIIRDNNIELIIHLAAKTGVRNSLEAPTHHCEVNINGTLAILETMRETNVSKLVFASSSSVYGNSNKVPFQEDSLIDAPISPYAATKRAAELLCQVYAHLYQFDISCVRLFTVYGPRQRPDLAIHTFTRCIQTGMPIPYYGDGATSRDYTYISDIVNGITAASQHLNGFNIFNLGGSNPISLETLVNKIAGCLQKQPIYTRLPMQPGDVIMTYGCIDKANLQLNYSPQVNIDEGINAFVDWYRRQHAQPVMPALH